MSSESMQAARLMYDAAVEMQKAAKLMAQVEAMKAENRSREIRGESPAYGEDSFFSALNECLYR